MNDASDAGTVILSKRLLFAMALAAGLAVANLYYNQPILGLIAKGLGVADHIGMVPTVTQFGYAAGLVFLVPLCDKVNRRPLILGMAGLLTLTTIASALAPNIELLLIASAGVGFAATITQMIVPMVAELASAEGRGKAIGTAFSGVLCGIILARVVSGTVGQIWGWRAAFWMAAGLALLLSLLLAAMLPRLPPKSNMGYWKLLGSMFAILGEFRSLRFACAIQACIFAAFSAFWSVLALRLQKPPYELGPGVAGAFGLVGVAGVLAAQVGGRLTDRFGSRNGVLAGAIACITAFIVMESTQGLVFLIAGVILLDLGLSLAQVSNQTLILGLSEDARGRINTVYVSVIFLGGAVGSAAAIFGWSHYQWGGVMAVGGGLSLLGALIHFRERGWFGGRQHKT